ncbi:MAG: LytTR family transcriptional regulator DNA-binding domain-containing protein [Lachnospiraceae bacterium]|nr:LytTR family transcriptional regulator DNA-binding domain-containing protein [Lachnospiraceae bacterium]
MKVKIKVQPDIAETEVDILCQEADMKIKRLASYIQQFSKSISCYQDNRKFQIPLHQILYLETIDGKTFLYTKEEVYQCKGNFVSLEAFFQKSCFTRISRNVIVNVKRIQYVEPYENHRLVVMMSNGEKILAGRTYIRKLKEMLYQL